MRNARIARVILAVTTAPSLASACMSDRGAPSEFSTIRDSAGTAIVENYGVPNSAAGMWRLAEKPVAVIGGYDGRPGHQFNEIVGAFRLDDGGIVVGDRGSGEVRFFDAQGEHLLTVGGQGEGPGEFRLLVAVDRMPGDTVIAGAWPLGLRVWWDSGGGYIKNTESGRWGPGLVGGRTLPDGTFLVDTYDAGSYGNSLELWAAQGEGETFRTAGALLRVTRGGELRDTIGPVVGEEWFKVGELRTDMFAMHARPYTYRTHLAFNDDRIFLGESHLGEVRVYSYDGRLTRVIRWDQERAPVTARDRHRFRQQVLDGLNNPDRQPSFERWLSAVPYPETKPAFRSLTTDRAGRLWVQAWTADEGVDRWLVFNRDGTLAAVASAPSNVRLLDAGDDYALLVATDELEVETVQLFPLLKN